MGVDITVFIGPFAMTSGECTKRKEVPYEFELGCSNCRKGYKTGNFCSDCGQELGRVHYCGFETLGMDEIVCDNRLVPEPGNDDNIFWYNNSPKIKFKTAIVYPKYDEGFMRDLSSLNVSEEIKAFEKEFTKELEILKEAYGSVKVYYGVISSVH